MGTALDKYADMEPRWDHPVVIESHINGVRSKEMNPNTPISYDEIADDAIRCWEAGASAIQLFDSWAGFLSKADYRRYVLPHSRATLAALADSGVPRIHFGVGTGELLPDMAGAGTEVIGVDYRVNLAEAIERVGSTHPVQGNLDPALLFAPWEVVEREVRRILQEGRAAPGHIFNLGHGVLPDTDPVVLTRVVELVHDVSAR